MLSVFSPGLGGISVPHALPYFSRLVLAAVPNGAFWARLHAVDVLWSWFLPEAAIETARLLVAELAGNAVRHGRGHPENVLSYTARDVVSVFAVTLDLREDRLTIAVQDSDSNAPSYRPAGAEATGGRDVFIVAAMSNRWGYQRAEPGPGKVVWAELLVSGAQANPPDPVRRVV
jgi:anti-sigma regulatory factor (Ser/Thr protein kinase)